MNLTAMLVLALLGACVFAALSVFNRLVHARNRCRNAWSSVDVNLRKRHDLIPNLVETVRGYASHERELLSRVTELRARAMASSGADGKATEARLGANLATMLGLVEAYPALKADAHFERLSRALTEIEEQISAARRAYNASVLELNDVVEQFPTSIVASVAGFRAESFFEWSGP